MHFSVLESDPWLSQVMGKASYRLSLFPHPPPDSNTQTASTIFSQPSPDLPVFLYCKVPTDCIGAGNLLQDQGFRLVDTNVTFEKKIHPGLPAQLEGGQIRWALPGDESEVVQLAQQAFRCSRFHLDPEIPLETANSIKGEWIRNFFLGKRGDSMAVAEFTGKTAGFLLVLESLGDLTIDLIAVGETFRQRGLAGKMVEWVQTQRSENRNYRVGTQISNIPSIRCYQKLGFQFAASQYVFHYHGPMPKFLLNGVR